MVKNGQKWSKMVKNEQKNVYKCSINAKEYVKPKLKKNNIYFL
jgi:hypothetical protein